MGKLKKYKLKTHKGTKKRFRLTGSGKLVKAKGRLIKKSKISKNAKRTLGKITAVSDTYVATVCQQLNIKSSKMKKSTAAEPQKPNLKTNQKADLGKKKTTSPKPKATPPAQKTTAQITDPDQDKKNEKTPE
jgi:large subunit ribosomal protein L35